MKLNLLNLVMLTSGIVLVYSAVKGYDPRDVVKDALSGTSPVKGTSAKNAATVTPVPDTLPSPIAPRPNPTV